MTCGGWDEVWTLPASRPRHTVAAGDVVEDALHDDDSDVNVAGDVGEELVDETVDRVEGIAGEDAGDGRGGIGVNAGKVKIGELGTDGGVQQGGGVGDGFAAARALAG